jgi:isoaspartyl peptidase/L-asparaginase-like protein (Ntn-hydrolase superfamily)
LEVLPITLEEAVTKVLSSMPAGSGGMIAVDAQGTTSMQFTTGGMFRGVLTTEMAAPTVAIY